MSDWVCIGLLANAQAQAVAIEAGDWNELDRLAAERAALQDELSAAPAGDWTTDERAALHAVAELDQQNLALVRQLMNETTQELRQVHHGQTALNGYARPTTDESAHTPLFDTLG